MDGEQLHIITTIVTGLCAVVVSIVGFIVHRAAGSVDNLADEVGKLKIKVAILLDRDRRQRISDYEHEGELGG